MRGLSPDAQRITRVLIDPHGYLFSSGQPIFPEEFPVLEPDIAMFIDLAGELSRIQGIGQGLLPGTAIFARRPQNLSRSRKSGFWRALAEINRAKSGMLFLLIEQRVEKITDVAQQNEWPSSSGS